MASFGRNSEKQATLSTRRLEAFSDGVFAIAATLLVLDLSVSRLGDDIRTNDDLFHALLSQSAIESFTSFIVSFALLAFFWAVHIHQFEWIVRVDGMVIFLNNLRLFFVVLIPFTASLNSTYGDLIIARMLMPTSFVLVSIAGALLGEYIRRTNKPLTQGLTVRDMVYANANAWAAVGLGVIVIGLAPFVGPWAFLMYVLDGPSGAFFGRLAARNAPDTLPVRTATPDDSPATPPAPDDGH